MSVFVESVDDDRSVMSGKLLAMNIFTLGYLLNYLLFAIFKNKIEVIWLKRIDRTLLVGVFSFIIPLSFLIGGDRTLSGIETLIFKVSILGLPIVTVIVLLTIILARIASDSSKTTF